MKPILEISYLELALAALFLLLPAWLSLRGRLGLHRDLLIGGLRCFGQLVLIGYVLRWIFAVERWYLVIGLLLVMIVIGGQTAAARQTRRVPGLFRLTTGSIFLTSFLTLAYLSLVIVRMDPWYDPRYLIPLAGMIVGNAMNGAALAAERLSGEVKLRRREIEQWLALGATPHEALREASRATIKASLIPTINGMMSVGLVHLPGMMTGQMLGGASPVTAIRYQIVIFYAIAFVTAATAIAMTRFAGGRYFTRRMQLRGELLQDPPKGSPTF